MAAGEHTKYDIIPNYLLLFQFCTPGMKSFTIHDEFVLRFLDPEKH